MISPHGSVQPGCHKERIMFCPRCATENPQAAVFCRQCGSKMASAKDSDTGITTKKVETFFKWIGYIVVGLIVFGMLSNL
jgi:uncharacterized membrane protein YvbJ